MKYKSMLYLTLILFFSQIINCESKSSDDEEKKRILGGLLLNTALGSISNTSAATTTTTTTAASNGSCANAAPTFSTLASAGVNSTCGKSGCHVGSSPQNGLDMTSYNSVIIKVTAKNANSSSLYQKINGGSMQVYTTSAITTAIFCWIQGGALP